MNTRRLHLLAVISLVAVLVTGAVAAVGAGADGDSDDKAEGKRWLDLLKSYPTFGSEFETCPFALEFRYGSATDDDLRRLRETYELDTIAGQGSELARIINLMRWVFELAHHASNPVIPAERNAFTIIQIASEEKKPINCYMKTVILNEVYLAMGFASRHTHLLPYEHEGSSSHFVTSVYSRTLGKWISMDPDFGAYVTDASGNILGVDEIRQRLVTDAPLRTVYVGRRDPDNPIEGVDYLWFMSCFVFKIRCPIESVFDRDSRPVREYYELLPDGYQEELLHGTIMTRRNKKILFVNDATAFWQAPKP